MKNLLIGLFAFTSISAFASATIRLEMPSIDGFSSDLYTIPSQVGETLEESMVVLASSGASSGICYTGKVQEVKKMLDKAVSNAKNVKKYSSFVSGKTLQVNITAFKDRSYYVPGSQSVKVEIISCE